MITPNYAIDLRDFFAAAALSGIVVKRTAALDTAFDNLDTAFKMPEGTPAQIAEKQRAVTDNQKALEDELKKFKPERDVKLAYHYAEAAIAYRVTLRDEELAARAKDLLEVAA